MTSSDYRDGWTYEGGALYQAFTQMLADEQHREQRRAASSEGTALDAEVRGRAAGLRRTSGSWFLPLKDYPPLHPEDPRVAAYHFDWLRHPDDDAYWQAWSIRARWSQITVPALNFEGWYDLFVNGAIENFVGMRKHAGSQARARRPAARRSARGSIWAGSRRWATSTSARRPSARCRS